MRTTSLLTARVLTLAASLVMPGQANAAWSASNVIVETQHSASTSNNSSGGGEAHTSNSALTTASSEAKPGNFASTSANFSYTFSRRYTKEGLSPYFNSGSGWSRAYALAIGGTFPPGAPSTGTAAADADLLPQSVGFSGGLSASASKFSSSGTATEEDFDPDTGSATFSTTLNETMDVLFKLTTVTSASYLGQVGRGLAEAEAQINFPTPIP
jgi:hypothetical protein